MVHDLGRLRCTGGSGDRSAEEMENILLKRAVENEGINEEDE